MKVKTLCGGVPLVLALSLGGLLCTAAKQAPTGPSQEATGVIDSDDHGIRNAMGW